MPAARHFALLFAAFTFAVQAAAGRTGDLEFRVYSGVELSLFPN
ncbi:MAG: hypothetical protein ACREUU_03860 [Gammaproteobacteria bacterium]